MSPFLDTSWTSRSFKKFPNQARVQVIAERDGTAGQVLVAFTISGYYVDVP
jgi:hypothetical protein